MKITLTATNAGRIEEMYDKGDIEVYINDNPIDHLYVYMENLVVEIEGYDREISFGEEIDVRIVQVIRNELEVDFEA